MKHHWCLNPECSEKVIYFCITDAGWTLYACFAHALAHPNLYYQKIKENQSK